ncbi:MAG TPA: glycine cleavage system aminomethyltransferase GcvT [Acidimicrobiales bacterium]|nr:glycine cleavage system aminomethyltransferase GcvT [Acidimicrobiales bacterium]
MGETSTALDGASPVESGEPLRHTALIDAHRRLGAKLVGFGGWEMPLSYGQGTIAEHRACREDSVVFDVSHLGTVRVSGGDALEGLQTALSNDLSKVRPGRAQYTHLLDDADGSVVDDIIVWWVSDDVFDVMPNASNTDRVVEAIGGEDTTEARCIIAVQGPHARARLATIAPDAAAVPRFGVIPFVWEGVPCLAAGTGYTGEDGVECAVPVDAADALWTALLATGIQPAGLGARDTLRLEAGLPLHGHELGPGITPLQAGLGWVVGWDKARFRGRTALLAERERGVSRRLVGLATAGRQPPREGSGVTKDGRSVGKVTSGNFSPMLEHGIALAFIDARVDPQPEVAVDIEQRGRTLPATVVKTPFTRAGQWAASA